MNDNQKIVFDEIIDFGNDDILKIQTAPDMYISYSGSAGAMHLVKEAVNNAVDELISPNNVGDTIDLYLDETTNTFSCTDNGRGVEFSKLEIICTKLQSGSKFNRVSVGNVAGQNGVGNTAINALSSMFQIISMHNGEKATITFNNGRKVGDVKIEKIKDKNKHCSIFTFTPSEKYLSGPCPIKSADMITWLTNLTYLLPPYITVNLSIKKKGKEAEVIKKFKNKNGLFDLVRSMTGATSYIEPIHLSKHTRAVEIVNEKNMDRFIGIEFAFTYKRGGEDLCINSFCNFINTVDGGKHVDAVKSALVTYLGKKSRASLSDKEAKEIDIVPKDIMDGLYMAIYLTTDYKPQFASQTKEKLSNENLFEPIKALALEELDNYFIRNPKVLKKLCDYIKVNAKARLSATKAKNTIIKKTTQSPLDDQKIKNLVTANNRGKDYKEILLIEGDSAGGTCKDARNPFTQALFTMKGVPLNSYGLPINKVMENEELRNLAISLGAGIGPNFDITKLKYDKIIIFTDSDIDGHRISSGICTYFIVHCPQIIEEGRLYRVLPPLYKVKSEKEEIFIKDKKEMIELTERVMRRFCDIYHNNIPLNREETGDLLERNRGYKDEVLRITERIDLHPLIVEFMAAYRKNKDFKKKLKSTFPELDIEDNIIKGVFEGKYQILIWDEVFDHMMKTLDEYMKVNNYEINYSVVEKKSKSKVDYTLFQLFRMMEKYEPTVIKRYKGLGELMPEELRETTMNPNKRTLIRLTMDDVEEELRKFRILHGPDNTERKEMMNAFKISKDDLDN